jgi:general secretion pathway protein M
MNFEPMRRFWSERDARQRWLLASAGLLAGAVVLYLALIEPAFSAIARLQRSLPHARAESAQLEALLTEERALKTRPPVATGGTDASAAIQQSLATAGLKAVRVVPLANGALQLTFASVPYAAWSVWLAAAERELGMHVVAVTVKAAGAAGSADVELALQKLRADAASPFGADGTGPAG